MPTPDAAVALLGDAHLRDGTPQVPAFVQFLDSLPRDIGTLAILGDLFSVFIGRAELLEAHHRQVIDALRRLRGRGCTVLYVEGNHDFDLARLLTGDACDTVAGVGLDLHLAGRLVHLAHGDLINRADRQYRTWRAVSKSRPFLAGFNLLPADRRRRIAHALEARLARTNLDYKRGFPLEECARYARTRIAAGTDLLVFGHFHAERRIDYEEGGRRGTVIVLPAWQPGGRYLRLEAGSPPVFVPV